MKRRRGKFVSVVLALTCWTALAAASAAAVVLLASPGGTLPEPGIDIVRSAPRGDAHWQLKAVTPSAAHLFFVAGKGPRADLDQDGQGDSEPSSPTQIELTSASSPFDAAAPIYGQSKVFALKSLADPRLREQEKQCLAEVVYHEGRGQPVEAEIAVGQTVINRALSAVYPTTLCGVVHQHGRDGGCQYSFACDELTHVAKEPGDWGLAQQLAERLLSGNAWLPDIGDATHMHPLAEHPGWVKYLQRVKRIGALVFYRGNFTGNAVNSPVAD